MNSINTLLPALQGFLTDLRFYINCQHVDIELEMDDSLKLTFHFYPQDWHASILLRFHELRKGELPTADFIISEINHMKTKSGLFENETPRED